MPSGGGEEDSGGEEDEEHIEQRMKRRKWKLDRCCEALREQLEEDMVEE